MLREVREVREAERAEAAEVRDVARVLEDVAATVDPDLGFRLLLQVLLTPDARRPTPDARRDRCRALGERLGFSADHLDDRLPRRRIDLPSGRAAEPSPEYEYSCVPGSRLTGSAV